MRNFNGRLISQPYRSNGINPEDFVVFLICSIFIMIFLAIISTAIYECYCSYTSSEPEPADNFSRTGGLINVFSEFCLAFSGFALLGGL